MRRRLKKISRNLFSGNWGNATYAHLTPFYHARKRNTKLFWNIDADDTTIMLPAGKAAEVLDKAEKLVLKEHIAACSLDMWFTKTQRRHWSLGVLLINEEETDFCEIFRAQKDKKWFDTIDLAKTCSLDLYLTYLKYQRGLKIETFYIENCYFIHWGNFIYAPQWAWISYWENGKVYFPLYGVLGLQEISSFELKDVYKISVDVSLESSRELFRELPTLQNLDETLRALYGLRRE